MMSEMDTEEIWKQINKQWRVPDNIRARIQENRPEDSGMSLQKIIDEEAFNEAKKKSEKKAQRIWKDIEEQFEKRCVKRAVKEIELSKMAGGH